MTKLPPSFLNKSITHRGLHDRDQGRVENAPQSFAAAIDHGYGIELDVQLSKDGVAMVFHDYHLGRLTEENGAVAQRTAADLGQIVLKDSTDTIPTLDETLAQIAGRVPVLIEIKDQDGAMGPNVGPLEKAVADGLENYRGDAAVMSFNPHAMAAVSKLISNRALGLVTDDFLAADWPTVPDARCAELAGIPDFEGSALSFISHNRGQLASPAVARVKSAGGKILCWTVRSQDQETQARTVADNITFEGYLA